MKASVPEYVSVLESAIADVGHWTWWTQHLPESFQVEFGGVQLWNPPTGDGHPPSGLIATRFLKPRLIYFLALSSSVPRDWSDRLHRDELQPFNVNHDAFTLSSHELCGTLLSKATSVTPLLGTPGSSPLPRPGESLMGLDAHSVGLVVAAESMTVVSHQGEMDPRAIVSSHEKWWAYWKEYWDRKDTASPLPRDYACEVTIPAGGA